MGDTEGALPEIAKICDNKPKVLASVGVIICTFTSVADAKELESYFESLERSFFLLEVGADNTGYNIKNKKVHKGLFQAMEQNADDLKKKSDSIMDEINESFANNSGRTEEDIPVINLKTKSKTVKSETRPNRLYYDSLNGEEKIDLINDLLDKGYENLSEFDKRVLKIITKEE
jgi:hypothetical protein